MAGEDFEDDHRGRDEEAPIVAKKGGGGGPPPPGGGMRALVLNKYQREDDGDEKNESFKYTLTGITGRIDLTDDAYEQPDLTDDAYEQPKKRQRCHS